MSEFTISKNKIAELSWLIILSVSFPWAGVEFVEGGEDAYVAYKLALFFLAIIITVYSVNKKTSYTNGVLFIFTLYAVIAVVGAVLNGFYVQTSLYRSIRYLIGMYSVYAICSTVGSLRLLYITTHYIFAICFMAILALIFGNNPLVDGRLSGYMPNMHPNALGYMAALGQVVIFALYFNGNFSKNKLIVFSAVCIGVLLMTQSRNSIGCFLMAMLVLYIFSRNESRKQINIWVICLFAAYLILWGFNFVNPLDLVVSLINRDGGEVDMTFTGRTDAYDVVFKSQKDFTGIIFGKGLAEKMISVPGGWVEFQYVDGSWHSAYLSSGVVGIIIIAICFYISFRGFYNVAYVLYLPIISYIFFTSFLESTVNDASFGLTVWWMVIFGAKNNTL